MAPALAFQKLFKKNNVLITLEEARIPMGLRKDIHIKSILQIPRVKKNWYSYYGRDPNASELNSMYKHYIPLQKEILKDYSDIIPGVNTTIDILRNKFNFKIGLTTGFNRELSSILVNKTEQQGLILDSVVASDDVLNGIRPKPFMIYKNLENLNISSPQSVIKVDDTISGIQEGLQAGCITVGVSKYSNYMNITDLSLISEYDLELRNENVKKKMRKAGAHFVIDSVNDLPKIILKLKLNGR